MSAAGDDEHQQRDRLHRDGNAQRVRHLVEHDRQDQDEGGAQERAQDRAEPADDDHEQELEGAVDVEGERLPRTQIDERPQRACDADHEGGNGERRELGVERSDPHQLGSDIHVADRHPLPAEIAAHQVLGDDREQRHEGEAEAGSARSASGRRSRKSSCSGAATEPDGV